MNFTAKVFIPLDYKRERSWGSHGSQKGKEAIAWRHKWSNLADLCKSLKKAKVKYEVEYHFGAEIAYAEIRAGKAVKQLEFQLAKAA